jgi:hypothetical protein
LDCFFREKKKYSVENVLIIPEGRALTQPRRVRENLLDKV